MRFAFHFMIFCYYFFCGYKVTCQNITISEANHPNEPSIAMDPKNPSILVAASNLNLYFLSSDTGRTWTAYKQTSPYGVWGDPVVVVDTFGHFYHFHLSNPPSGSWIDRIVCQKSEDKGVSWSEGSFTGKNGVKAQDKHWCAVDRKNNVLYLTWTQFDEYGSNDAMKKSNILFSKSTDQGSTWSAPLQINKVEGDCTDSDNTVEGAVPAVGPNGELYVSWAGPEGLVFNRSLDSGNSWLDEEIAITDMPGGWDFSIPGIYRANGQPVTTCDVSGGPNNGVIYVNWTDQRNGNQDTDVWLVKSTDGGNSWSDPVRVNNDDSGKHQFFTWMAVDQITGFLYFVFYDRRNHQNKATDVYMAISTDGGNTFINRKISESPFFPDENIFFGDYTNIVAHNNIVRPIWTRLDKGQLSVVTDITPIGKIVATTEEIDSNTATGDFSHFPNPADAVTYVSFKLKKSMLVHLEILDIHGKNIKTIISSEIRPYGSYIEPIDLTAISLSSGEYLIRLSLDGKTKTEKQLVIK